MTVCKEEPIGKEYEYYLIVFMLINPSRKAHPMQFFFFFARSFIYQLLRAYCVPENMLGN